MEESVIEEKILRGHHVFSRKLRIFEASDGLYGRQFAAGDAGRIDLLTEEIQTGSSVVIELKRGDEATDVVAQIVRYIEWVTQNLASRKQEVHGVICLNRSCAALESLAGGKGIEVYEYDLQLIRRA